MELSILLGYFILLIQFDNISCNVDNREIRSSRFDDPETITVLPQANNYEILSCRLDVKSTEESYSIKLYDKEQSFYGNGAFRFIGGDNNTCSFEIIISSPEKFKSDGGKFFAAELTMHEKHVCTPWWKSKLFMSKCESIYPINLIPQTWWENFRAAYISTTKIMRRANYNNESITILTPILKYKLKTCYFSYINKPDLFYPFSFNGEIKTYDDSSISSEKPGVKHIGYDDNSCSLKLSIEFLEKNFKRIYSTNCIISAEYYDSDSEFSVIDYDFLMEPITWWKENNYSRVQLPYPKYF